MGYLSDVSPIMPDYQMQDATAPNLGSAVSGGDPGMNAMLTKKKKSPFQSFLDFAQQKQQMNGNGGQQQQQQPQGGGILTKLAGLKSAGLFL